MEFGDYLGEGFVTVQAADAEDPFLAATLVAVRVHTSAEMCAVLDGEIRHHFATEATHTMERFVLEHADRLIEQGGDILGTYERFYRGRLVPGVRIRYPFRGATGSPGADAGFALREPLRLLYAGRLERRKGVHHLARATTALPGDDWLTFVGGDTRTGPLGTSRRDVIGLAGEGDPRVVLEESVSRERLAGLVAEHDVVVLPSLWECWPYAALEEREAVRELVRADAPLRLATELTDDDEIARAYETLLAAPRPRRRRPPRAGRRPPLVSAIVPYFRAHRLCATRSDRSCPRRTRGWRS